MSPYVDDHIVLGRLILGEAGEEDVVVEAVTDNQFVRRPFPKGDLESAERFDGDSRGTVGGTPIDDPF